MDKISPTNIKYAFDELDEDFDMGINFETIRKKTHIIVLEKPKPTKITDVSTKLF